LASRFSIEGIFRAKDKLSGFFGAVESRASKFARTMGRGFRTASVSAAKLDRAVSTVGIGTIAAGAAVGAGMLSIGRAANSVEDSMAKIATVITPAAGTVQDALAETKRAAIDWSKSHADSVEQFLDASYNMNSAGLNSAQALEGTRTALLLATGTMGDAGTASNLVATLFNNMGNKAGDAAKQMTRVGDVLAKTQALFQIKDLEQLNEGFKMGTPAALQYGVSLEQLSNVMGTLNTAGLQGSMAGTAFSATMREMLGASKELGFQIAKTATGGVDFAGTVANIEKKFGSFSRMTDKQKAAFQKAFGDEGLRGLSLMLGKSGELAGNLDKITNSAGEMVGAATKSRARGPRASTFSATGSARSRSISVTRYCPCSTP
jgi:TP901 family phage tail tape measure protein